MKSGICCLNIYLIYVLSLSPPCPFFCRYIHLCIQKNFFFTWRIRVLGTKLLVVARLPPPWSSKTSSSLRFITPDLNVCFDPFCLTHSPSSISCYFITETVFTYLHTTGGFCFHCLYVFFLFTEKPRLASVKHIRVSPLQSFCTASLLYLTKVSCLVLQDNWFLDFDFKFFLQTSNFFQIDFIWFSNSLSKLYAIRSQMRNVEPSYEVTVLNVCETQTDLKLLLLRAGTKLMLFLFGYSHAYNVRSVEKILVFTVMPLLWMAALCSACESTLLISKTGENATSTTTVTLILFFVATKQ